jgi:hypothetical protein
MDESYVPCTLYRSSLESIYRLGHVLIYRAHAEEKEEDKEESAGEDKEESEEPEAESGEAEEEEEEEEEEEPEDVCLSTPLITPSLACGGCEG